MADNFLIYQKSSDEKEVFFDIYLMIFGRKSRNLANGCLEIINTVDRLIKLKPQASTLQIEDHRNILVTLRHMMHALFQSKELLNEYASQVPMFLYAAPDRDGNYVDYHYAFQCYLVEHKRIMKWAEYQLENGEFPYGLKESVIKQLQDAKKKTAALMMVLIFTEQILIITDPGRVTLHGYRELINLLNSDVSVQLSQGEIRTDDKELFPRHQQTQNFLQNSPFVLEHIDRYVGLEQHDHLMARSYLNDTFSVPVFVYKKDPKKILRQAMRKDREWVKTVLTMLTVQYSGIALVEENMMRFPIQGGNDVLEVIMSGFNVSWRNAAKDLLRQNNLLEASEGNMLTLEKFVKLPEAKHWNALDWMRFTDRDSNRVLFESKQQSLIFLDEYFKSNVQDKDEFLSEYFYQRWLAYCDHEKADDLLEICYTLVTFVRDVLDNCLTVFQTETALYLPEDQLNWLIDLLRDNYHIEEELRSKRSACLLAATKAKEGLSGNKADGADTPQKKHRLASIPSKELIDYLVELQRMFQKQMETRARYGRYEQPGTYHYAEFLVILGTIALRNNQIATLENIPEVFPASSVLIFDLNMVEFLLPYYFAAQMQIAQNTRLSNGGRNQNNTPLDKKLEKLQRELKLPPEKTQEIWTYNAKPGLEELMEEVRRELADEYYRYVRNDL